MAVCSAVAASLAPSVTYAFKSRDSDGAGFITRKDFQAALRELKVGGRVSSPYRDDKCVPESSIFDTPVTPPPPDPESTD
jgi:hypothetical protein